MHRGESDRLAVKAKLVKFVKLVGRLTYAIAFIYARNDGLSAFLKHNGDVSVGRRKTRANVAHKQNNVRAVYCHLRLKTHLLKDYIVGLWLDTARIDNAELASAPLGLTIYSVTGDTWDILYY